MFPKLQPVKILYLFLSLLAVVASVSWLGFDYPEYLFQLRNFLLIYGSASLVYFLGLRLGVLKKTRAEHRLITSLILFLLFDSFLSWWVFLLLGVVTEVFQRVVRSKVGPVLNPAAAGCLILAAIGQYPSWWGVSFAPRIALVTGGISVAVILTLPIAGYVAYRYKKLWTVLAAFIVYGLVYTLLLKSNPAFVLLEGTILFFLLVMVVEPKTSPLLRNDQLIYGSIIGLLAPVLLKLGFYEANLGALLVANLAWHVKRFGLKKS